MNRSASVERDVPLLAARRSSVHGRPGSPCISARAAHDNRPYPANRSTVFGLKPRNKLWSSCLPWALRISEDL